MIDSATINEAADVLERSGWKGYAQAIREQAEQLAASAAQEARLRALVEEWREKAREECIDRPPGWVGAECALNGCADELDAALQPFEETGQTDHA